MTHADIILLIVLFLLGVLMSRDRIILVKEIKIKEKIIQDLEHKLSVVLDYATDGEVTKPNTDMLYIREEMHKKILREWKYAIQDYREAIGDVESKDRTKTPSEQDTKST